MSKKEMLLVPPQNDSKPKYAYAYL